MIKTTETIDEKLHKYEQHLAEFKQSSKGKSLFFTLATNKLEAKIKVLKWVLGQDD